MKAMIEEYSDFLVAVLVAAGILTFLSQMMSVLRTVVIQFAEVLC